MAEKSVPEKKPLKKLLADEFRTCLDLAKGDFNENRLAGRIEEIMILLKSLRFTKNESIQFIEDCTDVFLRYCMATDEGNKPKRVKTATILIEIIRTHFSPIETRVKTPDKSSPSMEVGRVFESFLYSPCDARTVQFLCGQIDGLNKTTYIIFQTKDEATLCYEECLRIFFSYCKNGRKAKNPQLVKEAAFFVTNLKGLAETIEEMKKGEETE